jgi:hypothetical protein
MPIVTATTTEHEEQYDDDNDERCGIHGTSPFYFIEPVSGSAYAGLTTFPGPS